MSKRTPTPEPLSIPTHTFEQKLKAGGLSILHFVCPLLFFTNLTRNPYFTQIALLNIFICVCAVLWVWDGWKTKSWTIPRLGFEAPLTILLAIALLSTLVSWGRHPSLRFGIQNEGIRIWTFTLVNMVAAIYLPSFLLKPTRATIQRPNIWWDLFFCLLWGLMWFPFFQLKNPDPSQLIWDPYGFFLYAIGLGYVYTRIKDGHTLGLYHVVFSVAMLAGVYGLMQYMGRDVIWSSPIQPYGGRPVSTFGNPNFLSSYLMLVSPISMALGLNEKGKQAWGYYFVAFCTGLFTLATLTRSTYLGLFGSYLALFVFLYRDPIFSEGQSKKQKWIFVLLGLMVLALVVFPASAVRKVQSPLARFQDLLAVVTQGRVLAAWHQRLMIWSSAWDMAKEQFLLGKGWGCFELFYPFYQGKYILTIILAPFRTHANNAHNVLLEIWSQVGFLGAGVAVWFMATFFRGSLAVFKKKADATSHLLVAGLLAGFVGMMIDNFFGNVSIFFAVPAFLFFWNIGVIYNEGHPGTPTVPLTKLKAAFLGLVVLLSVGSSVYYVKRWNQEVHYFNGFKAAKTDNVVEAIKELEKAYDWFGAEVNTNYELGNSYSRQAKMLSDKKLPEKSLEYKLKALRAYQSAVAANPGYDEIYFNLGLSHWQLSREFDAAGKSEESASQRLEAIKNLELALFINPLLRDGYGSLSNIYIASKDFEKSAVLLQDSVATFKDDKELWLNLGYAYTQKGREEEAYQAFRNAVLIDPTYKQAWNNLLLSAQKLNKRDPILEVPLLMDQMNSAIKRRDFVAAKIPAQKLVEHLPENADARLSLGNIQFYTGDMAGSVATIKKALELNPNLVAARINLAEIYRAMGKIEEARAEFQNLLIQDPSNADAKRGLASLPPR